MKIVFFREGKKMCERGMASLVVFFVVEWNYLVVKINRADRNYSNRMLNIIEWHGFIWHFHVIIIIVVRQWLLITQQTCFLWKKQLQWHQQQQNWDVSDKKELFSTSIDTEFSMRFTSFHKSHGNTYFIWKLSITWQRWYRN